jgi:hypothetical protein
MASELLSLSGSIGWVFRPAYRQAGTEAQRLRERQTAKSLLCDGNRESRETENDKTTVSVVLCFSVISEVVFVVVTKKSFAVL